MHLIQRVLSTILHYVILAIKTNKSSYLEIWDNQYVFCLKI